MDELKKMFVVFEEEAARMRRMVDGLYARRSDISKVAFSMLQAQGFTLKMLRGEMDTHVRKHPELRKFYISQMKKIVSAARKE